MHRTFDRAQALARIRARALIITRDYRLVWNRSERCFLVAHKYDRARRYRISARGCDCPCRRYYGVCKHWLGLADLARVEIHRYRWLGWHEDLMRVQALLDEYLLRAGGN